MVRSEITQTTVGDFYRKLQEKEVEIVSDFQRGDEDTGVWKDVKKRSKFVDSLMNSYGTGLITLVRTRGEAASRVLDGGNRLRTIRKFFEGHFKWNSKLFADLNPDELVKFQGAQLPCQILTIEDGDPPNTISDMFIRLNTTAVALSPGELCKAHGYLNDIWEIEVAKKIIGGDWTRSSVDDDRLEEIHERWCLIIGELQEDRRCGTLAAMIGFIISARKGNIDLWAPTNAFNVWSSLYTIVDGIRVTDGFRKITQTSDFTEDMDKIVEIFNKFLDIVDSLNESAKGVVLSKISNGKPKTIKTSPIWYESITGNFGTPEILHFYNDVITNDKELMDEYNAGLVVSDNHPTKKKMEAVKKLIKDNSSAEEPRTAAEEPRTSTEEPRTSTEKFIDELAEAANQSEKEVSK
jgi:hypothetical protein